MNDGGEQVRLVCIRSSYRIRAIVIARWKSRCESVLDVRVELMLITELRLRFLCAFEFLTLATKDDEVETASKSMAEWPKF